MMNFKSKVMADLLKHEVSIDLDTVKEVGVGETMFLFYLCWHVNGFDRRRRKVNLSDAVNRLNLPYEVITETIIPNLEIQGVGNFEFKRQKWYFTPTVNLTRQIVKFFKDKDDKKIIYSPKIGNEFNYLDAYNFGILLKFASDLNKEVIGNDYEFELKKEQFIEFYPHRKAVFETIMNFHMKDYNFVEFVSEDKNANTLRFVFHLNELKKYFGIKGGFYGKKI